ncbi:hypothetical protein [Anaerocolumna jejuensis]|uniref:hypothetical protein n=1 Tax=Anaerocolumna jejuensis TaxID=259063 RepID=UPI003F7B506A
MDEIDLEKYISENEVIYMILVNLENKLIKEYGDKDKLLYKGLFKANFYDLDSINELNNNISDKKLPKVLKQGEVVCVVGKPEESSIVGIFYHEYREPIEFARWTRALYEKLLMIWK